MNIRCRQLVEGTAATRACKIIRPQSKILLHAAEAVRCFIIERGEGHLVAQDQAVIPQPMPQANRLAPPIHP
jgi:hypothetical protein